MGGVSSIHVYFGFFNFFQLCKVNWVGIFLMFLTISVRQAGVAAHRAVTIEDDRPLDRHASDDRNVKF